MELIWSGNILSVRKVNTASGFAKAQAVSKRSRGLHLGNPNFMDSSKGSSLGTHAYSIRMSNSWGSEES